MHYSFDFFVYKEACNGPNSRFNREWPKNFSFNNRMTMHQMKSRGEQKLCFDISDDKYYAPTGLHFFKCVQGTNLCSCRFC